MGEVILRDNHYRVNTNHAYQYLQRLYVYVEQNIMEQLSNGAS